MGGREMLSWFMSSAALFFTLNHVGCLVLSDISQVGLWFYNILVDFELSSLICVVRNLDALAVWIPLSLPIPHSLFSPLPPTILTGLSQECGCQPHMAAESCFQTPPVMRRQSIPGCHRPACPVWCPGLRRSRAQNAEGWRLARAGLLRTVFCAQPCHASLDVLLIAWAAGHTWHSISKMCPRSDPFVSRSPLFNYVYLIKKQLSAM